jgi:hypothetical protein
MQLHECPPVRAKLDVQVTQLVRTEHMASPAHEHMCYAYIDRRMQNAAILAMKEKDAQERAALDAMRAEMRGKLYTYDHAGNVLPVTELDSKKLPPAAVTPTFAAGALSAAAEPKARKKADAGVAAACM